MALGPSTVFCVAVYACTVVMRPSTIPKLSLITLAKGARQLVVQDALLKIKVEKELHQTGLVWCYPIGIGLSQRTGP